MEKDTDINKKLQDLMAHIDSRSEVDCKEESCRRIPLERIFSLGVGAKSLVMGVQNIVQNEGTSGIYTWALPLPRCLS